MEGRKKASPVIIVPVINDIMKRMITCGEPTDRMTSLKLNLTADVMEGRSISKRLIMSLKMVKSQYMKEKQYINLEANSFSCSAKNLESRGVEGMKNRLVNPTRTVNNPSYEVFENLGQIGNDSKKKIQE